MSQTFETKIAQAAFCWIEYQYYGSESKAIRAFLRRKGMRNLDRDLVRDHLLAAAAVLRRTVELRENLPERFNKPYLWHLGPEEFEDATQEVQTTLEREFPNQLPTVKYMLAMAWHMPYVR